VSISLADAALLASEAKDERALSELRRDVDEELELAAREPDFRRRALAYRAIGQLRFAQKTELLRRGLEDESPACRGSALLSLELLSRDHPRLVNANRPLLHELANADANAAVRRLAVLSLKNGSPARDTMVFLEHLADAEEDPDLRRAASGVLAALKRKAAAK
jgi:HEAT repeat protein